MSNNYEPFVVSVAAVNQSFDARNAFRFRVMLLVLLPFHLFSGLERRLLPETGFSLT